MSRRIDTFSIPQKVTPDVSGPLDAKRLIICAGLAQMETFARDKGGQRTFWVLPRLQIHRDWRMDAVVARIWALRRGMEIETMEILVKVPWLPFHNLESNTSRATPTCHLAQL